MASSPRKFWRFLNNKLKLMDFVPPIKCDESIRFDDPDNAENFMHSFFAVYENDDGNELICIRKVLSMLGGTVLDITDIFALLDKLDN